MTTASLKDFTSKDQLGDDFGRSLGRRMCRALRFPLCIASRQAARWRSGRTVVLAYNGIGRARDAVKQAVFKDQMCFLRDHARVVTLAEILRGDHLRADAPLTCAITFDDGYASVHQLAAPILAQMGFPALVYLTVDAINERTPHRAAAFPGLFGDETMLTWRQIDELRRSRFSFGSHLCGNKDLTQLSESEALNELDRSRGILEQRLAGPCADFAYPFGYFDNQSVELVKLAGYRSAVTVMHRPTPRPLDPFRIPRMCVAPLHDLSDFRAMLAGDFDYLPFVQKARRFPRISYRL